MPERFRHIRNSSKLVKDEFYQCCAELEGEGFSWREMQIAHKIIGKWMFKRNWRIPDKTNEKDSEEDENKSNVINDDIIPTQGQQRTKFKPIARS